MEIDEDLFEASWYGGRASDVIKAAAELSIVGSYLDMDSHQLRRTAKRVFLVHGRPEGVAPDWSANQLDQMRRILPSIEHLLPKGIYIDAECDSVEVFLPFRTSVQMFCDVFPELYDSIIYSPGMIAIDRTIDGWRDGKFFEICGDYLFVRSGFRQNRNYPFWNLAEPDDVMIGSRTVEQMKEHYHLMGGKRWI